jgi:hypothetical protein
MDSRHEQYAREFFDELWACGFRGKMTPEIVKRLNELANDDMSPVQAAQIIYIELTRGKN